MTKSDDKAPDVVGRYADLLEEAQIEPYVLTPAIRIDPPTRKQMRELASAKSEDDADRALFGAQYDAVIELFDDQPFKAWNNFVVEFRAHMFGRGSDAVEGKSPA